MTKFEKAPVITVGRYAGKPIDQLPNSYLRWMITQDFPKEWLDAARKKLEKSDYNDTYLSVSRHAIDMFSKRFLHKWVTHLREGGEDADGIATFLVKLAEQAWESGEDVSKRRHKDDGIVKQWKGIRFVFGVNPNFPDFKDVITVMDSIDQ